MAVNCACVAIFSTARTLTRTYRTAVAQNPDESTGQQSQAKSERKIVDLRGKRMFPIKVGDSSAVALVSDVVFYHNGAVITCDSAVRYSDKRLEFFGNVVLNKDSTYIYGDRVEYNGDANTAEVFSPLVKLIDGDVTLYTFNLIFNTKDNIGTYSGGGTIAQNDNLVESEKGYYYSDNREALCVGRAELRNSDYEMRSDSISYNMDTEVAVFHLPTIIWNRKGEILSADAGLYDRKADRYHFESRAYIMTEKQEVWADTIDYHAAVEDVWMYNNVQVLDAEQKIYAFGDYGEYEGGRKNALLTRNPSIVSYAQQDSTSNSQPSVTDSLAPQNEQQPIDTLFMRADTMYLFTVDSLGRWGVISADSLAAIALADSLASTPRQNDPAEPREEEPNGTDDSRLPTPEVDADTERRVPTDVNMPTADSEVIQSEMSQIDSLADDTDRTLPSHLPDSSNVALSDESATPSPDSLVVSDTANDTKKATKQKRERRKKSKDKSARLQSTPDAVESEMVNDSSTRPVADSLSMATAQSDSLSMVEMLPDSLSVDEFRQNVEAKPAKKGLGAWFSRLFDKITGRSRHARKAQQSVPDSLARDSLSLDSLATDSLLVRDSLPLAAMQPDSLAADSLPDEQVDRIFVAYRNVKIYRSDFQVVCDSLMGFSADSMAQLFHSPIMWNESNQITAQQSDIYFKADYIDRAVFTGDPIMGSEIDTAHYNQVAGKTIETLFRDGAMYQTDVNGNGRTFYYMQDEKAGTMNGFLVVECADITFVIVDNFVDQIIYRGNPVGTIFPMDMIPETQPQRLEKFVWESDKRPTRDSVFSRIMRPSQRDAYVDMPMPQFPITERINRRRDWLIHNAHWADRNDTLSADVIEFIESIK